MLYFIKALKYLTHWKLIIDPFSYLYALSVIRNFGSYLFLPIDSFSITEIFFHINIVEEKKNQNIRES